MNIYIYIPEVGVSSANSILDTDVIFGATSLTSCIDTVTVSSYHRLNSDESVTL